MKKLLFLLFVASASVSLLTMEQDGDSLNPLETRIKDGVRQRRIHFNKQDDGWVDSKDYKPSFVDRLRAKTTSIPDPCDIENWGNRCTALAQLVDKRARSNVEIIESSKTLNEYNIAGAQCMWSSLALFMACALPGCFCHPGLFLEAGVCSVYGCCLPFWSAVDRRTLQLMKKRRDDIEGHEMKVIEKQEMR